MAAQLPRGQHGDVAKIAATPGSSSVAAAAVVGSWFSAIRLSEAEERERDVAQVAEPIPHARVVIAHG